MATISASFYRDGNRVPITSLGLVTKKTLTFAGGTANDPGDLEGTSATTTLFTVTGLVKARLIGVCTVDLAGATSTYEIGISGATAIFMPTTTCTNLDNGEIWLNNATPATYSIIGEQEAAVDYLPVYVLNGNDIIGTVKTADITAGSVDLYCIWEPISTDGLVVAA